MACLYLAPYHVATPKSLAPHGRMTRTARGYESAVRGEEWPYDLGDDPSFYSAQRFAVDGGRLTWGVCRPNLRNLVEPGDTIAFFGYLATGIVTEYRFCAFATVDRLVSQSEIWEDESLDVYRDYLNVLIAPADGGGFVHREAAPDKPHDDWLWRMTAGHGQKADFDPYADLKCTKQFNPRVSRTGRGELITLAPNYIIFTESPGTLILQSPPLVARHLKGDTQIVETWEGDAFSEGLRLLTLGHQPRRGLRTSNTGFQHVHMKTDRDPKDWRAAVSDLATSCGLAPLRSSDA